MKAVIADHLADVRALMSDVLRAAEPAAVIVPAANGADLHRALVEHCDATMVLIGNAIVGTSEEPLFAHVRKLAPDAAIGVLTPETDRERVLKAIYYGAVAIILTDDADDELIAAIRRLLAGHVALPRDVLAAGPSRSPRTAQGADLTPREREVIGLVGRGQSAARIAQDLKLSPHTVRVHVTRIMKKLDLRDRPALMHYAVTQHRSFADQLGALYDPESRQATSRSTTPSETASASRPSSTQLRPSAFAR